MQGTVPREEIHDLLEWADVMICPSREDPMPTVCAEAMMHEVPCLVSDSTGTASYIRNEYDGLVFANEDTKDLSDKINWCINNQSKLKEMGSRALKIYEHFFSTDAFETNLLKYVKEMI
jgi:glycosyltransferase involved in cell wall biosynthesis